MGRSAPLTVASPSSQVTAGLMAATSWIAANQVNFWNRSGELYRIWAMLKMTLQVQLVLRALLDEPSRQRYGLELCDLVGLASGTIYPILARLEQVGWLESTWEDPTVHEKARRPRRRLYHLTSDGAEQARTALARVHRATRRPMPSWNLPTSGTEGGQP